MSAPLDHLLGFPLMEAVFGRRSRRFSRGMEIPSGPLAFASDQEPLPLSEAERSLLVAVATGVTGWNFGVPFGPSRPGAHASYTVRYTGRTGPSPAGIGTPVLFHTDDDGIHVTNTRDVEPGRLREFGGIEDDLERIVAVVREHTRTLSDARLDLPAAPGHMLEPNLWWANAPASSLFMPVSDASEQMLGLLTIFVENGHLIVDDDLGRPAGDLAPFVRSGLLDEDDPFPLSILENAAHETSCAELAFMAHNMVLTMQAMGLGGLYFSGLNTFSVMGAFADEGVEGLGFRFEMEEEWTVPNPVGLDGVFEGLCPPYQPDMRAAVEAFVERKFGPGGTYDASSAGPWRDARGVKATVERYDDEMVDCLTEIARYVHEKHGRFPGTVSTMVLPGYVQAHHLDLAFYDTHYRDGAYLDTHAEHMRRWHGG